MSRHAPALLGFIAGGEHWLIDPGRGVQVIDAAITPVPLARPWYLGLVRRRQQLLGVIDLGGLAGRAVRPLSSEERLLVLPSPHAAALRVVRVRGLIDTATLSIVDRSPESSDPSAIPYALPWIAATCSDANGQRWSLLDVALLCSAPEFLQAGMANTC